MHEFRVGLDAAIRSALPDLTAAVIGPFLAVLIGSLCIAKVLLGRGSLDKNSVTQLVLSTLALTNAVVVVCVLVLTSPPAIQFLPTSSLITVNAIILIHAISSFNKECRSFFRTSAAKPAPEGITVLELRTKSREMEQVGD